MTVGHSPHAAQLQLMCGYNVLSPETRIATRPC